MISCSGSFTWGRSEYALTDSDLCTTCSDRGRHSIHLDFYPNIFLIQVFGLGNKTYEHYNDMGKYVDKRLEELGAERIYELGLGDDDAK